VVQGKTTSCRGVVGVAAALRRRRGSAARGRGNSFCRQRSGGGGGGVRFAQGGKPIFDFAQFSIHVLVVQKNI